MSPVRAPGAATVGEVSERSEFLPKPQWRTRAGRRALVVAIGCTFAAIVVVGWLVLAGATLLLERLDVPTSGRFVAWVLPTLGALAWVLRRPQPATASEDEGQAWSDYAVRAVMVGIDEPRPAAQRAITGVLFGAPLVVYLTITVILEALGFF